MSWGVGCESKAGKVYRNRMLATMVAYLAAVFGAVTVLKHGHPAGWELYLWATIPAIPLLLCLVFMGIYLRDEADEYMRMRAMRSMLVATGVLMAAVVVNDFLRTFAHLGALPPFTGFILFFFSFAAAQGVQQMMNKGGGDE